MQHGNVLLVPGSKTTSLAVKLIDYDGMFVPALAKTKSGEVGHPNYQHPQRLREGIYKRRGRSLSAAGGRHGAAGLSVGGHSLWERYDNGDNLLFKETDLRAPAQSALFGDLLKMTDRQTRLMVESLWHSCQASLEETPLIETLLPDLKATKVRVQGSPPGAAPEGQDALAFGDSSDPSPKRRKKTQKAGVPTWAWVAGGSTVAAIVVVGLVLAFSQGGEDGTRDKRTPVAKKTAAKEAKTKPPDTEPTPETPKIKPDPMDPPIPPLAPAPNDDALAAKFVGRFTLNYTGAASGTTTSQFSEDRKAFVNGMDLGTWRVERGRIVIARKDSGEARLERKDDNTFVGKNTYGDGRVVNWVLTRAAAPIETELPPPALIIGFTQLFNGKDLAGWTVPDAEMPIWRVLKGALVAINRGPQPSPTLLTTERKDYANFHLHCEALASTGRGGALIVHRGDSGYAIGISGVNSPADVTGNLYRATASLALREKLAGISALGKSPALGKMIALDVFVEGPRVRVMLDDLTVADFTEEKSGPGSGAISLLCQPGSTMRFRTVQIKELRPPTPPTPTPEPPPPFVDKPFVAFFNGKDLSGLSVDGGKPAQWAVEGNTIVGTSAKATDRTYLLSEQDYDNFILRFEVKVESGNHGVAIRAIPGEKLPIGKTMTFHHPHINLGETKPKEPTGTTHWLKTPKPTWSRNRQSSCLRTTGKAWR